MERTAAKIQQQESAKSKEINISFDLSSFEKSTSEVIQARIGDSAFKVVIYLDAENQHLVIAPGRNAKERLGISCSDCSEISNFDTLRSFMGDDKFDAAMYVDKEKQQLIITTRKGAETERQLDSIVISSVQDAVMDSTFNAAKRVGNLNAEAEDGLKVWLNLLRQMTLP